MKKNIFVTQPFLPPLEEYIPYLEQIWENKWLTNAGPLHQQLEKELAEYLKVPYISLFNNATIGLMIALKALGITGDVVTTPFSFVATAHSLLWANINPVFIDIDPSTFNLDPEKIEAAITPATTAIMPVHCYGLPCNVEAIKKIADKHNLKVIYDAAHAFGIHYKNESLLKWGDLSVISFHATKVFNTFEGGAIVSPDKVTKKIIDKLRNFGFEDEQTVDSVGLNGKMSEPHAGFGLLQLFYIDQTIEKRKKIDSLYREGLKDIKGIYCVPLAKETIHNYSYFPIIVEDEYPLIRDELFNKLREQEVYARRYFYPLISDMDFYKRSVLNNQFELSIAHNMSRRVICLPIYPDLSFENQEKIIYIIKERK